MPRAEVGSTKYLNNKLKAKGLQRLRWYCQVCERQMRDENGFKQHCLSETHVRQMLLVGEDPKKAINDFSKQFERDFLQQLRTAHGTKAVHINHFYQEYIGNKEHVHMNSTRWPSLTEFAKYLGREGICRVEESDKGLQLAWIDNSPDALRRQEALRKREQMNKDDEEREQRLIREQIRRAQDSAKADDEAGDDSRELQRVEGERITLNFTAKPVATKSTEGIPANDQSDVPQLTAGSPGEEAITISTTSNDDHVEKADTASAGLKLTFGSSTSKPKNVFAAKKNPLAAKKSTQIEQPKKMSEAERIMREEIEKKRSRESGPPGFNSKRLKIG